MIIAPEHQAAPRLPIITPEMVAAQGNRPSSANGSFGSSYAAPANPVPGRCYGGTFHRDSEMSEMDMPDFVPEDPKVREAIAEMTKRQADVLPTNAAIEQQLMAWEQNYLDPRTGEQRWEGQERWLGKENEESRLVNIMHPYEFIAKLRRAGIDARLEESKHARIWLNDGIALLTLKKGDGTTRKVSSGRIGVNAWLPDERTGKREVRTVTTLQYPYGPEFSILRFNEYDVPQDEKYRGWRTALVVLVISGVLSEEEAERAFGPAYGPAGVFYKEQLYKHRAMKYGLVSQKESA